MCGDLEEDVEARGAELLYAQFQHRAQAAIHDAVDHRGGARNRLDGQTGSLPDRDLHAYMDGLFADVLGAVLRDGLRVAEGDRYRVLAAQAVVLSRLAGFLSGQLDPLEDPLRTALDALTSGYDAGHGDGGHHH